MPLSKSAKKTCLVIALIGGVPLLGIVGFIFLVFASFYFQDLEFQHEAIAHNQKFDDAAWRNQDEQEKLDKPGYDSRWPPRLCMVDDLIASGKLNALSKDQVLQLLGPPHDKGFPYGAVNCDIHYYLGPERSALSMDSEWLFITFGVDGKVDRCWLYRD